MHTYLHTDSKLDSYRAGCLEADTDRTRMRKRRKQKHIESDIDEILLSLDSLVIYIFHIGAKGGLYSGSSKEF